MYTKENEQTIKQKASLSPTSLKRTVDYTQFEFETTEQVHELTSIVGQDRGRTVKEIGLNINKVGYNIYVSGISGTGKTTFTHSMVKSFAQTEAETLDWCYVYDFEDGNEPIIIKLAVDMGTSLQKDMEDLVQNLKTDIPRAFDEESYQKERASIIPDFNDRSSE